MSACPAEEFDGGRGLNPSFREDRRRELFPLPRASVRLRPFDICEEKEGSVRGG